MTDKTKLTQGELFDFVLDNFHSINTKNGMVNLLRGRGLSCSQERVYEMYDFVKSGLVALRCNALKEKE